MECSLYSILIQTIENSMYFGLNFQSFSGFFSRTKRATKQFKEHKPEDILYKKICEENDCFASRYIEE